MSIDHILDKLTDKDRDQLKAYINQAVEDEVHDREEQLCWGCESGFEDAYEQGYNDGIKDRKDSIERSIQDRWKMHNELSHFGGVEMCDQSPCNLF